MNEDLSNQSSHNSDPADVDPAKEETKQKILDEIEAKSIDGYYYQSSFGSFIVKGLELTGDHNVSIHVLFVPEKDRKSDNGAIEAGSVVRDYRQANGLIEKLGYKLFVTPDRTIEIEKDLSMIDPQEEMRREVSLHDAVETRDYERALQHSEEDMASIVGHIEAHKEQRGLGLNFVNETEAAGLLSELQQAQPKS
jgi:hypothetical protein